MKKLVIKFIKLYQMLPISTHHMCRFYPTCSNYTIMAVEKYGVIKGLFLGIKRIIRCNPTSKGGIDLP